MDSAGLSQNELAERTNVPQPTIHRILIGESKDPRHSTVKPLADFFGVTVAQLRGDEPMQDAQGSAVFDRLLAAAQEQHPDTITGPASLARLLDESPQTVTNWKNRGVPVAKITALARAVCVNPEWLETGEGPMMRIDLGSPITTPMRPVKLINSDDELDEGAFAVPRYTVKASAGNGMPVLEIDQKGQSNYCRYNWASRNGYRIEDLFSMAVEGDSMEPTIPDGASIIVHKSNEIVNGKPHVICRGDECFVKRLFRQMDGTVLVKSDNSENYTPWTARPDDVDQLYVIGQVVSVSYNL